MWTRPSHVAGMITWDWLIFIITNSYWPTLSLSSYNIRNIQFLFVLAVNYRSNHVDWETDLQSTMIEEQWRSLHDLQVRIHVVAKSYRKYTPVRSRVNRMVKSDRRNYKCKIIRSFKKNSIRFYGYRKNTTSKSR